SSMYALGLTTASASSMLARSSAPSSNDVIERRAFPCASYTHSFVPWQYTTKSVSPKPRPSWRIRSGPYAGPAQSPAITTSEPASRSASWTGSTKDIDAGTTLSLARKTFTPTPCSRYRRAHAESSSVRSGGGVAKISTSCPSPPSAKAREVFAVPAPPVRTSPRISFVTSATRFPGAIDRAYRMVRRSIGRPAADATGRVLFVYDEPGAWTRYRCEHGAEELRLLGVACDVVEAARVDLSAAVDRY